MKRKRKLRREENARQVYAALMDAAEKAIGIHGYAATSIAKITDLAGVSQGTFYNYFDDRQAMFDRLLPHVGERMMKEITSSVPRDTRGAEREVARFRAFADFLARNPGFYRILYEAEIFAPEAHRVHIDRIATGYRRALERSIKAGDIDNITPEGLDAVVFTLIGARGYIAMLHKDNMRIPEAAIEAYARLVTRGLFTR